VFAEVVGISLLAPCAFRLRRRTADGFDRTTVTLAPRSAYLLSGPARTVWEHSIPPVEALRYSITFRNFKALP
jgi:alkylated DNA repair dioxygenase AlkB